MAKFNGNVYKDMDENEQKEEIIKVLPILQEMMVEEDYNRMREDFHSNKHSGVPFWKFLFENVEVKYKR